MKKSLSAIVSLAMAFSMFSSVALGATSADFKDLNDLDAATKAKFDAMISAGIFDGVSEDTFGLKDKMNRAQFAKVAALIFGLKVDTSLKTSSFSDVKTEADDPANGYALPYIEALKAAGLTDGYAPGQYNPAGEVTKQELATFLVRGLGWEDQVKSDVGVSDKTVSDWAKGYVALAIEKKILTSGEDGTFGGTSAATRDLLVTAAYEAQQAWKNENKPAKASVAEAKATGAKQVTVTFNRDVDTAKAKLTLKKGTNETSVASVKFADDKKSAVITTDSRLSAGTYSVTLSGLEASEIEKATAEFTAQDETVSKIEFVNANDTIAQAKKVIVKVKATNQYGENATFAAGAYTVNAGDTNPTLKKNDAGELLLQMDTASDDSLRPNQSIIPVYIYHNDTRIQVTKNFKLGNEPFVSKLEVGSIVYPAGKDAITTKGETARADLLQYDQYGNLLAFDADQLKADVSFNVAPYTDSLEVEPGDSNNDDIGDLKFSLKENIDKAGDYTVNVYSQAGTATVALKLNSTKVATKVEFGEYNNVIANGDKDAYIPIVAYDASGNKLSVEDLTSEENLDRIELNVNGGATNGGLMTSGEHKGKLKISNITASSGSIITVSAMIATPNANSYQNKQFTVQDARVPERFKVTTEPAKKIVPGAESKFEIEVYDQYDKELKEIKNVNKNGDVSESGDVYAISVTASTYTEGTGDIRIQDNALNLIKTGELKGNIETFTKEGKFVSYSNTTKNASFTFAITKNGVEQTKITREIEVLGTDADLTYSVDTVPALFNAIDSSSVYSATYGSGTLSDTEQENATLSKLAREVKLVATDAGGNKVALPNTITSINAGDQTVARTGLANGKGYVIGNKKGSTTVIVGYTTNEGTSETKTVNIEVKDEAIKSAKISAKSSKEGFNDGDNVFTLAEIKVTDNYGKDFEKVDAMKYNYLFGVVFSVTNVEGNGVSNSDVTVDQYGKLTIKNPNVKGFDLTASTPTGLSASTAFTR
ncbi:S-layer homology domain-containing protein [Paenibacillus mucilaginosus]|nr:S-layer homology domain-containing protein [Paenibacillus mucilaginosus]MCG7215873.1 S-layer homology domain-containing protein [Paenibacillus mucilaginosus]WDM27821.1 S-layer homology domain-containing protein [Paenibacillus mucilaginosus]